jgi:hypothetical protein
MSKDNELAISRGSSGLGLLIGLWALFFMSLLGSTVQAQEIELNNLVLDSSQAGHIRVRFGLSCPVDPLLQALDSGAKVRFDFEARLYRERPLLWDEFKGSARKGYTLFSQALSQEFVLMGPSDDKQVSGPELGALFKRSWSGLKLDLGPWQGLKPGSAYMIDLSIHCQRVDVPLWLRRALFFWSWDVLPSSTYQLRFEY